MTAHEAEMKRIEDNYIAMCNQINDIRKRLGLPPQPIVPLNKPDR